MTAPFPVDAELHLGRSDALIARERVALHDGSESPERAAAARDARREELKRAIEHAAHYLPSQGPIGVFIHHNTLHAFEHLPFHGGVEEGARVYGCEPYLPERRYREFLASGRIDPEEVEEILDRELRGSAEEVVATLVPRRDLRSAMLLRPLYGGTDKELRWFVAESDALIRFRDDVEPSLRSRLVDRTRRWAMRSLASDGAVADASDVKASRALREQIEQFTRRYGSDAESWSGPTWNAFALQAVWRACREGVHGAPHAPTTSHRMIRHRDLLHEATGVNADQPVGELLIRFCGAFLDQGVAAWHPPAREEGFLASFIATYGSAGVLCEAWRKPLAKVLRRWKREGLTSLDAVQESLDDLGVMPHERDDFLRATALALRGWAGMVVQVEQRHSEVARPIPPGSFEEYLAVRLLLDRLSLAYFARRELGYDGPLADLNATLRKKIGKPRHATVEQRAFVVFQLAQVFGWSAEQLAGLSRSEWFELLDEIESFGGVERRRLLHTAYEEQYFRKTLDAIGEPTLKRQADRARNHPRPSFQAVFCIDEREESFRRRLEETTPACETFGAAGFFCVPIYYRGAGDADFSALCPAVMKPKHWVTEDVVPRLQQDFARRRKARRLFGQATRSVSSNSHNLFLGAVLSAGFGWIAALPLTTRVLFPRLTARLRQHASVLIRHPNETFLHLERGDCSPDAHPPGLGFQPSEMADIVERMLRDMGLVRNFARLVLFVGHGAGSVNNPHQSAYNCGACGGGRGGPNARSFAAMANDPRVRETLRSRGVTIPDDTQFVGGFHDTTADSVEFSDVDQLPAEHQSEFAEAERRFARVSQLNAQERCRRFVSAPLDLTPEEALVHVENRAEDLSQVRPEAGHATNAVTFVGRRARTRGLYMDRRCFLTSYDPAIDDDNATIVGRILGAVVPVCAGINLEYYFSFVDPYGYGCATKLPHNVSGFLGVMDGAASDLRTGLPWQMVEIHEPMRSIFIVETTEASIRKVMIRDENVRRAIENEWIRFVLLHPQTGALTHYQAGEFVLHRKSGRVLETFKTSYHVFRGQRDHLDYALIASGLLPEEFGAWSPAPETQHAGARS